MAFYDLVEDISTSLPNHPTSSNYIDQPQVHPKDERIHSSSSISPLSDNTQTMKLEEMKNEEDGDEEKSTDIDFNNTKNQGTPIRRSSRLKKMNKSQKKVKNGNTSQKKMKKRKNASQKVMKMNNTKEGLSAISTDPTSSPIFDQSPIHSKDKDLHNSSASTPFSNDNEKIISHSEKNEEFASSGKFNDEDRINNEPFNKKKEE